MIASRTVVLLPVGQHSSSFSFFLDGSIMRVHFNLFLLAMATRILRTRDCTARPSIVHIQPKQSIPKTTKTLSGVGAWSVDLLCDL